MALDYSSSSVAIRMVGHGISPARRAFFTNKWVLTLLGRRNLFCCCCCGVQIDPMFFHNLGSFAASIPLLMLQSWRGNHWCNKANWRVQSAEGGRQLLLQQNQKLQSAKKRERHPYCSRSRVQSAEGERAGYSYCSKPKGSICRVRETIVAAAKSNGSICKGKETDILPEANPKGSICRGRKTHTYTHLHSCCSKAKPSICRGREKFLLAVAADQSFNLRGPTLHSYEKQDLNLVEWPICHLAGCNNNLIRFVGCHRYPHHLPSSSLTLFFISTLGKSEDRSPASCWRQPWSFLSTSKTLTILKYIENRENRNGSDDDPN